MSVIYICESCKKAKGLIELEKPPGHYCPYCAELHTDYLELVRMMELGNYTKDLSSNG